MVLKNQLTIILILISIIGCTTSKNKKMINLKDCHINLPFEYKVDRSLNSILSIYPKNVENGIYQIHFKDNLDDKNGAFRKFLASYSNHNIQKIGHLELIQSTDTNLDSKIYFLIGKQFYITFVKNVPDINNFIKDCNQNWKR